MKEDEDLEKLGKVRRAFEAAEFREQRRKQKCPYGSSMLKGQDRCLG